MIIRFLSLRSCSFFLSSLFNFFFCFLQVAEIKWKKLRNCSLAFLREAFGKHPSVKNASLPWDGKQKQPILTHLNTLMKDFRSYDLLDDPHYKKVLKEHAKESIARRKKN